MSRYGDGVLKIGIGQYAHAAGVIQAEHGEIAQN
jgi:hypothetical protein